MSKPVKQLIQNELVKRFQGVSSMAVVGFTGIDAIATRNIRGRLREKDIRMTVVKNSVARQAFKATGLETAGQVLDGPCAIVHGADSVVTVVRELLELSKDAPNLKVKAAILDGDVFAQDRIEELSKYPNHAEALGRAVACVLSAGGNLAGCLIGPGAKNASLLKAIQEKHEKAAPAEAAPAN